MSPSVHFLAPALTILVLQVLVVVVARRLPFGVTRVANTRQAFFLSPRYNSESNGRISVLDFRGGDATVESEEDEEVDEVDQAGSSDEAEKKEESDVIELDEEPQKTEEEEEKTKSDVEEEDSDKNPMSSVIPMEPVAITVRTSLGNSVLDQSLELTVHRSRDVASLKQSISRQLPGRPPVSTMRLTQGGIVLKDELMVDELVDDEDEDEDDESGVRIVLNVDMVPPVDPKFISQLGQRMDEMAVSELLDAYAMNEAAVYLNTVLLLEEEQELKEASVEYDGDTEESGRPDEPVREPKDKVSVTLQLKQQAARIRKELEETLLNSEQSQKIIKESRAPAFHLPNLQERQVRGRRVRQAAQGGVKTTLKRKLQRNLNIHWADTLRHFCLFLFFGWFGGRTPLSRAILLLGAPSVFLLQARSVKLWIRQVLYALIDHPPSIFLSLLPAPQQTILSLDVKDAMKTIYGNHAVELASDVVQGTASDGSDDDGDEGSSEYEGDDDDDPDDESDDE